MKKFGNCANVYTLSDVFDNVFYVGCTTCPMEERLARHLCDAKHNRGNAAKNDKIKSLGYNVIISSVEFISTRKMSRYRIRRVTREIELRWIFGFHKKGFQLTNGRKELKSSITMYGSESEVKEPQN